jgi:hypothetical protein
MTIKVVAYRKQETHDTQTQETSAHVGDSAIVDLLSEAKTSQEEGHAKDKKQVGQDGAKQRSLNNANLILNKSDDEDDEFDCVAESDIEQSTNGVAKTACYALGGVTEQAGEWDDSNGIEREDDRWAHVRSFSCDTNWYEYQEHVDPAVAKRILGVNHKALASLDGTGSHWEFGSSGGISAIKRLYGGISRARSFGLDRG